MRKDTPKRNVGELGEDEFKRWCSLAGLSAVKSSPDRMGWDYFVEFPPEYTRRAPLDRQNNLIKALVQIKSTDVKTDSVRGKISALKHLVDSDLAAFILSIEYLGARTPRRVRLLHVGFDQIESVLRVVRTKEKGGRTDLHSFKMSLSLRNAAELAVDGSDFCERVLEFFSGGYSDYICKKRQHIRSCGYSDRSIKGRVTLKPGHTMGDLVDLLIGRSESVQISEMIVEKERFGISLESDIDRLGSGVLKVDVRPAGQAVLRARTPSRSIEVDADVFAPGIPWLPVDYRKLRVANDFAEIIIDLGIGKSIFRYSIDPEKRYSLDVLARAIGFAVALSENGAVLEIDLASSGKSSFPVCQKEFNFGHLRGLYRFVDVLATALFRFYRNRSVVASILEMQRALLENSEYFSVITNPGLELSAMLTSNCDVMPSSGTVFIPAFLHFCNLVYAVVVRADSSEILVEGENNLKLKFSEPIVVEGWVIDRDAFQVANLNQRAAELASAADSKNRFTAWIAVDEPRFQLCEQAEVPG